MPAYIVSKDTMSACAAALQDNGVLGAVAMAVDLPMVYDNHPDAEEGRARLRRAILKRWAAANARAVTARYGGKKQAPPSLAKPAAGEDRAALLRRFQALRCLHYQCSEAVQEEQVDVHRVDLVSITCAMGAVASSLLNEELSGVKWD